MSEGRRDIHVREASVRIRTADHGHPGHAREAHVVDELRLAGEKRQVLLALDRRADDAAEGDLLFDGRHRYALAPAACWTAWTMLW